MEARTTYERTALHTAADRGHSTTVEVLLARGADMEARTNTGKTAFDLADEKVKAVFAGRRRQGSDSLDSESEQLFIDVALTEAAQAAVSAPPSSLDGFFQADRGLPTPDERC